MRSTLGATVWLTAGLVVALSWAAPAGAAPGDLDGSFSDDGWVRTLEVRTETNNYLPKGAEDLAIQPDGKIVAVGELQDGSSYWYFGVFRYLPDGELDPGFGDGGWVATDLGSFPFAHAVALQPDGKIVVAGEGDCHLVGCFVLVRYNEDGSLDTSFGEGDGVVKTMFGQCGCRAFDVAVGSNGKIVAVGLRFRGADAQDDELFAWRWRMSTEHGVSRSELVELVKRLMAGSFASEEEEDRAVVEFASRVPHPNASDLIFHWDSEFDSEPTAEQIVDRALSYRAIEL
jgi:uncharacterized delta-60 repeat protein